MTIPVWLSAALIGLAAATWSKAQVWISRLVGLFVTGVRVDGPAATAVLLLLQDRARFRQLPSGNRAYAVVVQHVRTMRRTQAVAAEFPVTQAGTTFLYGWRPLWLTDAISGPNSQPHQGSPIRLSFVRGTFDADWLVRSAVALYNSRVHGSARSRRFNIRYRYGRGGYQNTGRAGPYRQTGDEPPARVNPVNDPHASSADIFQLGGVRLLDFEVDDLGPDVPENAVDALSLDPAGLRLVADVRRWLAARDWYRERGIPWRMGCLLHGPTGTGKSSLVRALGCDLDLPITAFDLTSMSNEDLHDAWGQLLETAPCIGLIEDVDRVFAGDVNVTGDKGGGLTYDALLNCVSGVGHSDGVLLFVTTNHPDKVDPALGAAMAGEDGTTRPGRLDRHLHMGPPNVVGRRKLAARICRGHEQLIEPLVAAGDGDSGAQFQRRCAAAAEAEYWKEQS